ncbi:MAG: hypothetical protein H6739_29985 [Alphaproteobacteria bacterium]|nr:hypothetical protein [Alphaproteobacteria bacterium]
MAIRLDSIAPSLAASYWGAPTSRRERATRLACELAVRGTGLAGPEVTAALEALRTSTPDRPSLRSDMERLAARLDDEYFRLDNPGREDMRQAALQTFSKARAASALTFALSSDDSQLHEAIYEAVIAMDDPSTVIQSLETALGPGD